MDESYYVCWDAFGNRAVILCKSGYPIQGVVLPDDIDGTLAADITYISEKEPPLGGMRLDTARCITVMESTNGITVTGDECECGWEMSEYEKRYIASR